MQKKLFQKWMKALKSGEFKQGSGALFMSHPDTPGEACVDRYCCLGVLAKIQGLNFEDFPHSMGFIRAANMYYIEKGDRHKCIEDVPTGSETLAEANDGFLSFESIAESLETVVKDYDAETVTWDEESLRQELSDASAREGIR